MKKILGIFAASAAALGSAMISAPAHAQSAILPVEVQVTPAIFLRTYKELKFTVNGVDLGAGSSVDQTTIYDEKAGLPTLLTTAPTANGNGKVIKKVPILYQLWSGTSSPEVRVTATKATLTGGTTTTTGDVFNQNPTVSAGEVTMGVVAQAPVQVPNASYKTGSADFTFTFPTGGNNPPSGTTFKGGEIEIRVVTP